MQFKKKFKHYKIKRVHSKFSLKVDIYAGSINVINLSFFEGGRAGILYSTPVVSLPSTVSFHSSFFHILLLTEFLKLMTLRVAFKQTIPGF
jgi:hypothetical protein